MHSRLEYQITAIALVLIFAMGVGARPADARAASELATRVTSHHHGQLEPRLSVREEQYPIGIPSTNEPSDYAPPSRHALRGYAETYETDFQGKALPKQWAVFTGPPGGDPGTSFAASQVKVKGGVLTLTASRSPLDPKLWITGGVCSCKLPMTFGAYFVRSRITGPGPTEVELLWPASNKFPPEIDFNESWGTSNEMQGTDHYIYHNETHVKVEKVDLLKWHTFGLIWTKDSITYILDGHAWWTIGVRRDVPIVPMTLDLTQQTWCSEGWACPKSKQSMDIDWVVEYKSSP